MCWKQRIPVVLFLTNVSWGLKTNFAAELPGVLVSRILGPQPQESKSSPRQRYKWLLAFPNFWSQVERWELFTSHHIPVLKTLPTAAPPAPTYLHGGAVQLIQVGPHVTRWSHRKDLLLLDSWLYLQSWSLKRAVLGPQSFSEAC